MIQCILRRQSFQKARRSCPAGDYGVDETLGITSPIRRFTFYIACYMKLHAAGIGEIHMRKYVLPLATYLPYHHPQLY